MYNGALLKYKGSKGLTGFVLVPTVTQQTPNSLSSTLLELALASLIYSPRLTKNWTKFSLIKRLIFVNVFNHVFLVQVLLYENHFELLNILCCFSVLAGFLMAGF